MSMSSAKQPGKIVAFYSFKGGTGRTMALANVGCLLAERVDTVRPVLLIDWDLEAPGLHRYFQRRLFGAFKGVAEAEDSYPGLLDLFKVLDESIASSFDGEQEYEMARSLIEKVPLSEYIISTDIRGLHIMKAGRSNREYAETVSKFDWHSLYRKSPFLLRAFADVLADQYQYVLIDSRTGLTDTSGICTMLLPEVLVAVFTPNRQSVAGVVDLVTQAIKHRSNSDDLRPLVVYPLPSRIEASEPDLRKQWRSGSQLEGLEGYQTSFERAFRDAYQLDDCSLNSYFDDIQIQHVPRYAYGEELAVLEEESKDRFSLTQSFQRFVERIAGGGLPWEEESKAGVHPASTHSRDVLPPGARLADSYEVRQLLSAGGFTNTYQAMDLALGREVVVKEYMPRELVGRASDGSVVLLSRQFDSTFMWGRRRFAEEASVLARLQHPSIVKVFRIFEANQTTYSILEYLNGFSLETWLETLQRVPTQEELDRLILPLLDALEVIHGGHFLHRDIKPNNIFLRAEDHSPVLLGFSSTLYAPEKVSSTTSVMISRGYSPAEQYSSGGRNVGPWTDIYGLAATLYRAITGSLPIEATERVHNDTVTPATMISGIRSTYRKSFLAAIDFGLAVSPRDRPQSVAEWRKYLLGTELPASRPARYEAPTDVQPPRPRDGLWQRWFGR